MKRWKLFGVILLILIACNLQLIYADDTDQTDNGDAVEEVEDSATPAAAPRDNYLVPLMFASAVLIVGYIYIRGNNMNKDRLEICSVSKNPDGSMTVTCRSKQKVHHTKTINNEVVAAKGTAIILNENLENEDSLKAVINEDTKLIWKFNNQSLEIDGDKLKERKEV